MTIEERVQQAAEQLLGDESLTDEMDDLEAQILLDWGIGCARQIVEQTFELDDGQAEENLSATLQNLRQVIRRTNKLIGRLSDSDDGMIAESLAGIFESAVPTPSLVSTLPDDLPSLSGRLAQLPAADALTLILSLLNPEVTDGS